MGQRIGQGYDVHRLVEGRPLVLGGERIPFAKGLEGFSDADVLLHALGDALLGAAALGDIGQHFPDSDPAHAGAASSVLLGKVCELLNRAGFRVSSVDITVIAEAPRLAPHIGEMKTRLAGILELAPSCVSIKATTTEGLGFAGRREGLAAHAVAVITGGE